MTELDYYKIYIEGVKRLQQFEGLYSNDPADPGGETYYGIARVYHPRWHGWALVDAGAPKSEIAPFVMQFYMDYAWYPLMGESIAGMSSRVWYEVFEQAVNFHPRRAAKHLQLSLNMLNLNGQFYADIAKVDGVIGPETLKAYRSFFSSGSLSKRELENMLLGCLNGEQYIFYKNNPRHEYFRGWFSRVLELHDRD